MEHLHTKVVAETTSGKPAVMARKGIGHPWRQIDSSRTIVDAEDYATRIDADADRREFVIDTWYYEKWGDDAPTNQVITQQT